MAGPRQSFTVKIHPPHPDALPPLGGEGMIFMSGGDQIPVMMVCDSNSGKAVFAGMARSYSRSGPCPRHGTSAFDGPLAPMGPPFDFMSMVVYIIKMYHYVPA